MILRPRLSRRRLIALGACLPVAAAADRALAIDGLPDWFNLDDDIKTDVINAWTFDSPGGDAGTVRARRRHHAENPVRVFVLYPRQSSAYDTAITKILSVFAEKDVNAEIVSVNYGNDDARGQQFLARVAAEKGSLIFSMGSESTAWLFKHYARGPIPVVSVCSKDPVTLGQARSYDAGTGTHFAFTSLNMPVDVQLAYILNLLPELRNFGILVDSTNVSAVETQANPIAEMARRRGIQVIDIAVQKPANAEAELRTMVAAAVATMRKSDPTLSRSAFWITGSTAVFKHIGAINAHADRVPVLSVVPEVVDAGDLSAVVSIGISFESNAHLAAIYGAEILSGRKRAGELPVGIVSPPDIAINFRIARQIGLRIPFSFVESASIVYDYDGQMVRRGGTAVQLTQDAAKN